MTLTAIAEPTPALVTTAKPRLSREQVQSLRVRGNGRPALYMLGTFAAIAVTLALGSLIAVPAMWLVCIVVIGALQHHLSIIQHEAVHYLLLTNRRMNDAAGSIAAYMIFFTMRYRAVHWQHHRELGHDDDPDLYNYVNYPNDLGYVIRDMVWHFSGLAAAAQFVRQAFVRAGGRPRGVRLDAGLIGVAVTQAVIFGCFALWGTWWHYLVLWIVPLVTVAKSLAHFRNVVEHAQVRDTGDPETSRLRTVLCSRAEGFFFAPMNFNYHAEHHIYMGVPYHQLPRCHALLAAQPAYRDAVEVEHGYLRFLFVRLARGGRTMAG